MILVSDGDITNPHNNDILAIDDGNDEITIMSWHDWLLIKSHLSWESEYDVLEPDPDLWGV